MEWIKSALYFISVLGVLVVVHEWGHFIVAKLCKMRVDDFSLFFGPRLWRVGVRNGTEYNIRSIPLGGFVKIAGMEPDDLVTGMEILKLSGTTGKAPVLRGLGPEGLEGVNEDNVSDRIRLIAEQAVGTDGKLTENGVEELQALVWSAKIHADEQRYLEALLEANKYEPDPNAYNQKPLWQRAAVIFAGPFMSIFFSYLMFCVMGFTTGLPEPGRSENVVDQVVKGKPAFRAGIKPGDRIVEINGTKILDGESMVKLIRSHSGQMITITALRKDEKTREEKPITLNVTPEPGNIEVEENGKIVKKSVGLIGIGPKIDPVWKRYPPMEAISHGSIIIYNQVMAIRSTLFSKEVGEKTGGILRIGQQIHEDSKDGPRQVLVTAAMLSLSLGILNLFPIPILDGGQLVLLGVEGLRRRKLTSKEVYAAQLVGLSIIGVLFVLVMYNDIMHVFIRKG